MPLYEYYCPECEIKFAVYCSTNYKSKTHKCQECGRKAKKVPSLFTCITDTNFGYTGKVDKRLGDRPIEGRADWKRRLKEKGLYEMSWYDVKNMPDSTAPERAKKKTEELLKKAVFGHA